MKKLIALMLALVMVMALAACGGNDAPAADVPATDAPAADAPVADAPVEEATDAPAEEAPAAMTYADYVAAPMDSEVVVECYVQDTQSWWEDKITVYAQDKDGAYFLYELACSQEDAEKMVRGTKIRVTGFKGEWAGEVEIMDGTFEFVADAAPYVAKPLDATALLGTEDLINYQNQLASFSGLTVDAVEYKNGESGDDIYLTLSKDGTPYNFCVEVYLTGPGSAVYDTAGTLKAGDIVDVTGYLYWYEGVNPHVTSITVVSTAEAE